jgi:tricarballylate dehydrogenase
MLNRRGRRFVDEGEDQNLFTYAKFGRAILGEPGARGYQLFDSKVLHLLEPRYSTSKPITAHSMRELIAQLDIDDREAALKTVETYNSAQRTTKTFDPTQKDGHATRGLDIDKTNWATRLDQPPYFAYSVTGGITFTFGGLRINDKAQVIGTDFRPLPGLYTCGEMVGGLFYDNYPAGTGLVSGATFGRIAGRHAAAFAMD